jgi:hypothetical protein
MSIIFAKETLCLSLTSAAPGSSQEFVSSTKKNLKMSIKILVVERFT